MTSPLSSPQDRPAPEGYAWKWIADSRWRLGGNGRTCRMRGCKNQAVAALQRKHGHGSVWWHYCAEHLYGRRIEDGIVKSMCLVELEIANAE